MTPEQFYQSENMPDIDKHDRKAAKFTYFDLLEFAEKYAAHQNENLSIAFIEKVVKKIFLRGVKEGIKMGGICKDEYDAQKRQQIDLAQKLKADLVQYLRLDNLGQANKPYLIYGDKTYTRQEIADEIEGETEFGLNHLFSCVHLASTLIQRDTKGSPQERYDAALAHLDINLVYWYDYDNDPFYLKDIQEVKQALAIAAGITQEKI